MTNISFLSVLHAEQMKIKNNAGFLLLLSYPVLSIIITLFMYSYNSPTYGTNHWMSFAQYVFFFFSFYPIVIATAAASFCNIEYKNTGLKHLFTLPVPKIKIYAAKWCMFLCYNILSIIIAYAIFILSGTLLNIIFVLGMSEYEMMSLIVSYFCKIAFFTIIVAALQLFFSLLFTNFVIPIGISFLFTIISLIAYSWKFLFLIPYSGFHTASMQFVHGQVLFLDTMLIVSIVYFLIASIGGIILFKFKK
jgi:hypothetical protein